jgi:membrane-bound serine protease (ClpP class)
MRSGALDANRTKALRNITGRAMWLIAGLSWIISLALAPVPTAAQASPPRSGASGPLAPVTTITPPTPGGSMAVPAARQAKNIAVITIFGEINATTAISVQRRIDQAVTAGANALVFQLDTPGGEVGAVLEICTAIKRSPIANTVAWVNPNAYSGGAIIALACREIVLARGATMGDALPIQVSFGMLNKLPENERQKILAPLLAEVVDSARLRGYDEKLVQGLVTLGVELWMVESTERPGELLFIDRAEYRTLFEKDPTGSAPRLIGASRPMARGSTPPAEPATSPTPAVDAEGNPAAPSGTVPAADAPTAEVDQTTFNPAAPRLAALTREVTDGLDNVTRRPLIDAAQRGKWKLIEHVADGQGVFTFKQGELFDFRLARFASTADGTINNDDELKGFFGATHLARLNQTWSEALVRFLTNTVVRMVLIAVFLLGLFVEMTHPGLVAPGTVAAAALFALIAPPLLIGAANWWPIAAVMLGVVLLFLEILVLPGFGIPGIVGLLALFGGLVGVISPSGLALFPDSPVGQSDVLFGVATVAISGTTSLVAMYFIAKHFGSLPILNKLVLTDRPRGEDDGESMLAAMAPTANGLAVGSIGRALTPLRPSGRIEFGLQIIDVVAETSIINPGEVVRISSVSPFRITVERAAPGTAYNPDSPDGGQGGRS